MSVPWSYLNFTCGEFFISTWQSQTEALLFKVCINLWHILSHHRTEIDRWTEYSMKKFCLMTYLCTQPPHPGYAYTRCLPYHENNSQYSSRFQYMSCWSSALANQDHPPRRKHLTPRHLMTGSPAVDIWRPRPFCPISGRILYPMCCCGKLQRGLLTMLTRPPTGLYLMTRKMRKIVKRWYFRNAKGMKGIKVLSERFAASFLLLHSQVTDFLNTPRKRGRLVFVFKYLIVHYTGMTWTADD